MTNKRTKIRHGQGLEPIKVLIQRVEFDEDGQPVVIYEAIRIEPPSAERKGRFS